MTQLLHSLNINPMALPVQQPGQAGWDSIYALGMPHLTEPTAAAELAAAGQMAAARHPVNQWAQEFEGLNLNGPAQPR